MNRHPDSGEIKGCLGVILLYLTPNPPYALFLRMNVARIVLPHTTAAPPGNEKTFILQLD